LSCGGSGVPSGAQGFAVDEGGRAEVAGEQPRLRMRVGQEGGQHDEEGVEEHDRPLHAEDQAAVRRHPVAEARQPRLAAGVEDEGGAASALIWR
jgi:hypothetical protein